MPSWRRNLLNFSADPEIFTGVQNFKQSQYYQIIQSFLSSQRLQDVLSRNGYELLFKLHPGMSIYSEEFEIRNNSIKASYPDENIQTIFRDTQLLVTDYSSVAFNFAYMKKPVIYYQFDENDYWQATRKKSYFDFRRDGFGEVINQEMELIEKINFHLENGCIMDEQYMTRVERTFAFRDAKNCKRIFETMMKLIN